MLRPEMLRTLLIRVGPLDILAMRIVVESFGRKMRKLSSN